MQSVVDVLVGQIIRNFFGQVDHGWLIQMLELRIADPRILRLIRQWLRAGELEDGVYTETVKGTPRLLIVFVFANECSQDRCPRQISGRRYPKPKMLMLRRECHLETSSRTSAPSCAQFFEMTRCRQSCMGFPRLSLFPPDVNARRRQHHNDHAQTANEHPVGKAE